MVNAGDKGDLQFGSDSVHAGDQNGLDRVLAQLENKPPNPPISVSTPGVKVRRASDRSLLGQIRLVNVYAGIAIAENSLRHLGQ